jgi:hypothetical protein
MDVIDKDELERAVSIQQRSYKLLKWVGSAMELGFISPESAHDYTGASDAAVQWINRHYLNFPPDCRPESQSETNVRKFANMFSPYLLTSFDIDADPGLRLETSCGCYCPWCSRLVAASHLKTKKITAKEKKRAFKLKASFLRKAAMRFEKRIDDKRAEEIIKRPDLKEAAALAAYGDQLVSRMKGHVEGPALLVLWREFAWTASGSPKKKFKLEAYEILKSVATLLREFG